MDAWQIAFETMLRSTTLRAVMPHALNRRQLERDDQRRL
jgi:hypothetical protein